MEVPWHLGTILLICGTVLALGCKMKLQPSILQLWMAGGAPAPWCHYTDCITIDPSKNLLPWQLLGFTPSLTFQGFSTQNLIAPEYSNEVFSNSPVLLNCTHIHNLYHRDPGNLPRGINTLLLNWTSSLKLFLYVCSLSTYSPQSKILSSTHLSLLKFPPLSPTRFT